MTIRNAIKNADRLKPNGYDDVQKVMWLNELDRKIFNDVISTHKNAPKEFSGYNENTDVETELLVCDDYSDLYTYYLAAMIDYYNNETARYSNDMAMYNSVYNNYTRWYNRTSEPVNKGNFKVI